MNWVDIAVGAFMILFFVAGARTGFIREVTGFVGLVFAFVLGVAGTPIWSEAMVEMLRFPPSVATVASFILIFALVYLLCKAGGGLLFKFVRNSPLDLVDRLAGSIVGLLKGGLIISLVLILLSLLSLPQAISQEMESSTLTPPIKLAAPAVYNLLKEAFPQLRSLGEVVGRSVEDGVARGKEQILEKGSQMVDELQKAKTGQQDNEKSGGPSGPEEEPAKRR